MGLIDGKETSLRHDLFRLNPYSWSHARKQGYQNKREYFPYELYECYPSYCLLIALLHF